MEQVTYNGLVVLRWIECVGAVSPKTEMDNPSNIPSSSIRLIYLEFLFFEILNLNLNPEDCSRASKLLVYNP